MSDDRFQAKAIALSEQALQDVRKRPFGAVVVSDGEIVGEGVNQVLGKNDPTSHAEVEAIRAACAALGTTSLKGCTIYTSCEPCSMCASVILLADLDAVVYGASLDDSRGVYADYPNAPRAMPLTALELRAEVGQPIEARRPAARRAMGEAATEVLRAFAEKQSG